MSKEDVFWEWFKENKSKYYNLSLLPDSEKKEQVLDEFLNRLHKYNSGLYFEIGGVPNGEQELIISAEGDVDYFEIVESLVAKAPKMEGWHIIALKPPMGATFITNYEGIRLNPKEIWFLPLDNKNDPTSLGIMMCFPNYEHAKEQAFIEGAYQVLDVILGEKSVTLDIQYLEVNELPDKPKEKGLIELIDLPAYIKWRKNIKSYKRGFS